MGEEEAAGRYEPGPAFEEVKHEAMLDLSPTVSKEFWLIQWIKDKDFDVSKFHGKELSLKLHQDGSLGSLESSSGKSYDLVSFAYQQPNASVFLPSGSETKAVGKISRRVCLFRHKEHEELERPSFGSLTPNNNSQQQQQQQPSLLVPSKLSLTPSSKKSSEVPLNHKGLLHMYSQERGIEQPLYCTTQKDPLDEPLLKSKVVIDGLSFESPEEYHTLKATEIAAAEQAVTSISQVPSICYRKILQEFAQKEHYPSPCYSTRKAKINDCVAFISTVEIGGEIFVGKPRGEKKKAKMNAAKVACQHFEEKRKGSDSSAPVLGGSDMQNATIMQSAGQVIHSGELGHSVPKISTVTCYKTNDSDAGLSKIRQGSAPSVGAMSMEQIPEHKMTKDESDVGHLDVSGRTSEGLRTQSNVATEMPQTTPEKLPEMKKDESRRCRDAQSNTATEMPQVTPEKPPQKKVKMAEQ